jgi:hypothetical protein
VINSGSRFSEDTKFKSEKLKKTKNPLWYLFFFAVRVISRRGERRMEEKFRNCCRTDLLLQYDFDTLPPNYELKVKVYDSGMITNHRVGIPLISPSLLQQSVLCVCVV